MKKPETSTAPSALDLRDVRVKEWQTLAARLVELKSEISSFDFVLSMMDPNHVKFDFAAYSQVGNPQLVIESRPVAEPAPAQPTPVAEVAPKREAKKPAAKKKQASEAVVDDTVMKVTAKKQKSVAKKVTPVNLTADERTAAEIRVRGLLNDYMNGKNTQSEIENILRGLKVPSNTETIAREFRNIHPFDTTVEPGLHSLFKTRIQSQIAALMKKGLVRGQDISDGESRSIKHYSLTAKAKKPKTEKKPISADSIKAAKTVSSEAAEAPVTDTAA